MSNEITTIASEATEARVFSVPVDGLTREEQFGVAGILKAMESMIKARLKEIEPAIREEAAAAPLTEEGGKQVKRVSVDGVAEVVEYQPRVDHVLDAAKVREALETAEIDPETVLTPVVSYTINEAKLDALVELGHLDEQAVDACKVEKRGRVRTHIRAIGALKSLLEGKRSALLGNKS